MKRPVITIRKELLARFFGMLPTVDLSHVRVQLEDVERPVYDDEVEREIMAMIDQEFMNRQARTTWRINALG